MARHRPAMGDLILVAGCTGVLGRHVVKLLQARGHRVRALTRDKSRLGSLGFTPDEVHEADALDPARLTGACDGVTRVFSCLGASVQPLPRLGRATFSQVDWPANRNLVDEAKRAGVSRMVYVSVHGGQQARGLDYMDAHERVVEHLQASGLDHGVVRPTGFFSALESLLEMAQGGTAPLMGGGTTRSNPIHDEELAAACVEMVEGREREVEVGGPEVLTRKQMVELAFAALGKPPKFRHVPLGVARMGSTLMKPFHPRLADLGLFYAYLHAHDGVAPLRGQKTLGNHLKERARARGLA
ncbi:MAG: SDR family oxidoreductase [Myxococcota bacterium]